MKLIWINLIAIVIAISSLVVERPAIEADFNLLSSITSIPHYQSDVLRNDSQKHQEKTLQIAQDFIPIVVIADVTDANEGFAHYLPLYNLHRQKEYFLLI
jgi:hypothetical protein